MSFFVENMQKRTRDAIFGFACFNWDRITSTFRIQSNFIWSSTALWFLRIYCDNIASIQYWAHVAGRLRQWFDNLLHLESVVRFRLYCSRKMRHGMFCIDFSLPLVIHVFQTVVFSDWTKLATSLKSFLVDYVLLYLLKIAEGAVLGLTGLNSLQ